MLKRTRATVAVSVTYDHAPVLSCFRRPMTPRLVQVGSRLAPGYPNLFDEWLIARELERFGAVRTLIERQRDTLRCELGEPDRLRHCGTALMLETVRRPVHGSHDYSLGDRVSDGMRRARISLIERPVQGLLKETYTELAILARCRLPLWCAFPQLGLCRGYGRSIRARCAIPRVVLCRSPDSGRRAVPSTINRIGASCGSRRILSSLKIGQFGV